MFADLSWSHILIVGGVLFVLFGARRFPEIGRNLGRGINNLYRGVKGAFEEDEPPSLPPGSSPNDKLLP